MKSDSDGDDMINCTNLMMWIIIILERLGLMDQYHSRNSGIYSQDKPGFESRL